MKRFALSLLLIAFGLACTDAASPDRHPALTLKDPTVAAVLGGKPPPPVDAVIAVTITTTPVTAIFTGVFFNNGKITDDGLDAIETFDGMAWLRFDNNNKQPEVAFFASAAASANARFMVKDLETPTGSGTLTIGGVDYKIGAVISFSRFASCGVSEEPSPCAHIEFLVTDPDGVTHEGHLLAFDKSQCLVTDPKLGFVYECDLPPIPD